METMNELMLHFLQDIFYAERLGVREMQKLARAVDGAELKAAILQHRDQSLAQISRLEKVFELMGKRPRGKTCAAMDGLVEEAHEAIDEGGKGPVVDAALLATAQAIDHYEIARYGAMLAWAKQLGMTEAAALLQQTLDEEKASDAKLTELALGTANPAAEHAGAEHEEEAEPPPPSRPAAAKRKKPAAAKPAPAPASAPAPTPAKKPTARRGAARK